MTKDNGRRQNMTITLPRKLFYYTLSFSQRTLILLSWICLFEIHIPLLLFMNHTTLLWKVK